MYIYIDINIDTDLDFLLYHTYTANRVTVLQHRLISVDICIYFSQLSNC